jgi:hypothetical protein
MESPAASGKNRRMVPFDQLVTFDLTGKRDNVLNKIFNISAEGYLVATALSYSLLPLQRIQFGPTVPTGPILIPVPTATASQPIAKPASKKAGKKNSVRASASANTPIRNLTIGNLCNGFGEVFRRAGLTPPEIAERTKQLFVTGLQLNPALADLILSERDIDGTPTFDTDSLGEAVNRMFQTASFPERQCDQPRVSERADSQHCRPGHCRWRSAFPRLSATSRVCTALRHSRSDYGNRRIGPVVFCVARI